MKTSAGFGGALFALAIVTAACGGGGQGRSSLPAQSQNAALSSGKALLTIPNPATSTSSTSRKAQFIASSAVSVGLTVNGGTPAYSDVSASSSLCSATTSGRTCAIPLGAPAGNATFGFTLYDGPNGSGKSLGTGTATQMVVIGTAFTVPVAMGGIVASVAVMVPVIDAGPTSVPVTVTAKDADGNTIVGPAPYPSPITLTDSDATGTLTLSQTTVNTPNDAITLAYSGSALSSAASISATATGLPASTITAASVLPLNYFPVALSRTYATTTTSNFNYAAIGTASPMPTYTPSVASGSYTASISGGATFNGVSGVQAVTLVTASGGYSNNLGPTYQSITNNTVTILGTTLLGSTQVGPACPTGAATYSSGEFYVGLPLVTGATSSSSPALNETITYPASCNFGYSVMYTLGYDTSNNYTETDAYGDGSSVVEHDNADGTGSLAFTPGNTTCSGVWQNALVCTMTAATESISAPAGGNVTLNVSQTTSSGTQTGTLVLPTSEIYPNGIPKTPLSVTTTVGAPIASAPAPCAVTAAYQGPVVPITTTSTSWYPSGGSATFYTEVDYLAPSIGKICVTQTNSYSNPVYTYNGGVYAYADFATPPLPLQPPAYIVSTATTETDSLVSVGPPLQSGTVITTGQARAPVNVRSALMRPSFFRFHGAATGGLQ